MWFLAYKSPFLQGTYTFLSLFDLLTPVGVTSFNFGPGTVFSYNGLGMILPQLTVMKLNLRKYLNKTENVNYLHSYAACLAF